MSIAPSILTGQQYLLIMYIEIIILLGSIQCTLMAGVFNNRPPKPRYTFVWDIETVLNYLSKLPDKLSLPIRLLSHKLALLPSLTAASRVSEICYLNADD